MIDNTGLWQEIIVDGKSSINIHKPKIIHSFCGDSEHYFEINKNNPREVICKHCGLKGSLVVGAQKVKDGKILPL